MFSQSASAIGSDRWLALVRPRPHHRVGRSDLAAKAGHLGASEADSMQQPTIKIRDKLLTGLDKDYNVSLREEGGGSGWGGGARY